MYAWLFARLPGPLAVRVLQVVALVVLVVAVCFTWLFPLIADRLEGQP